MNNILQDWVGEMTSDDVSYFKKNWKWVINELTVMRGNRVVAKRRDRSYLILGKNVIRCWMAASDEMSKEGYRAVYNRNGFSIYRD